MKKTLRIILSLSLLAVSTASYTATGLDRKPSSVAVEKAAKLGATRCQSIYKAVANKFPQEIEVSTQEARNELSKLYMFAGAATIATSYFVFSHRVASKDVIIESLPFEWKAGTWMWIGVGIGALLIYLGIRERQVGLSHTSNLISGSPELHEAISNALYNKSGYRVNASSEDVKVAIDEMMEEGEFCQVVRFPKGSISGPSGEVNSYVKTLTFKETLKRVAQKLDSNR